MAKTRLGGHLILGAGCAGLSLALALVREGVREPITLVDARTDFGRDRTWCMFDVGATPFASLIAQRWATWELGGVRTGCDAHPYVRLDSRDVYAAVLEELRAAGTVELRLGERVLTLGDGWVRTDRGRLEAERVYDALALGSPALRDLRPALWQRFLGHEVETERAIFDPGVATLMDFAVDQVEGSLTFMYVLPFSVRRALVEHTTLGPDSVPAPERRAAIGDYLRTRGAGPWRVEHEERGAIPMTTADLAADRGERTVAIGVAGGAVRPSSGYAFGRIQTQVTALARSVVGGQSPHEAPDAARRAALDAVFLRVLAAHPERFPEYFERMAAGVPGDVFARFMTDASSAGDDARVIAALPKRPFALAALQTDPAARRRLAADFADG